MVVTQSTTGEDPTGEIGSTELMQTVTRLLESQIVADRVIRDLVSRHHPGGVREATSLELHAGQLRPRGQLRREKQTVHGRRSGGGRRRVRAARQREARPELDIRGILASEIGSAHRRRGAFRPATHRLEADLSEAGSHARLRRHPRSRARHWARLPSRGARQKIRSQGDAERWFGVPVIAALPRRLRGGRKATVVEARSANPALVAAVEVLRGNLVYARTAKLAGRSSSDPMPQEGKSFVAANLAYALASSGQDVITIDADLRRPALHRYLGANLETGGLDEV